MITREELRQLAQMESKDNAAVTFYYQPRRPQNKSHREELILVKDLVRQAARQANAGNGARRDLDRILEVAEQLHGNHARAKAIFACHGEGIWREFDLPSRLARTELAINRRFHLRPIASLGAESRRCCIALLDRERARLFRLWMGEISEREGYFDPAPRRGRTDGFAGYDAGHKERHIDNEVMHHFKLVAERLQEMHSREPFGAFLIGCREELWPEIESHLHPYVKQRVIGRFPMDPATATAEDVRREAERILDEHEASQRQGLLREVIGGAQRNGLGALGLRRVLQAMERGEVQTLLVGETFSAKAAQCAHCGHLDTGLAKTCAGCGQETHELEDIGDALVRHALRGGLELVFVRDEELEKAGNIGARLRFRADQNTPQKLAS